MPLAESRAGQQDDAEHDQHRAGRHAPGEAPVATREEHRQQQHEEWRRRRERADNADAAEPQRHDHQQYAGVLGGTQSLHTDAYDEALALPTDRAALIALRTQQIIAEETGVVNTVDPLGCSYYLESLTEKMEQEAREYFRKIDVRNEAADDLRGKARVQAERREDVEGQRHAREEIAVQPPLID